MTFLRSLPASRWKRANYESRGKTITSLRDARPRTPAGRRPLRVLLAALVERLRKRLDPNAGVAVRARLTYAIGRATIAMGDDLSAFRGLRAKPLAPPGLCIEVANHGTEAVIITEVGLTRGEDGPQIALRDPLLHDSGPWPRRLEPGDAVVAHFGSGLAGHRVLPEVRRSYALTMDGRMLLGPAAAVRHYQARTPKLAEVAKAS